MKVIFNSARFEGVRDERQTLPVTEPRQRYLKTPGTAARLGVSAPGAGAALAPPPFDFCRPIFPPPLRRRADAILRAVHTKPIQLTLQYTPDVLFTSLKNTNNNNNNKVASARALPQSRSLPPRISSR